MNLDITRVDTIEARSLRWYGYVCRMPNNRQREKIMECIPTQRRKKGLLKRMWKDGIRNAMTQRNLQDEDWRGRYHARNDFISCT